MANDSESFLYKTIKYLLQAKNVHICIHDTSGIIHNNPLLALPFSYKIHSSFFCNVVKSTSKGIRACLKCKALSIKKAISQEKSFTGQCCFGLTEMVHPVFLNGKLLCIIYLGGFIDEGCRPDAAGNIYEKAMLTGASKELTKKAVDSLERIEVSDMNSFEDIIEIIANHILLSAAKEKQFLNTGNLFPTFSKSKSWIIQSMQNYIHTYYNRELKLSQFAHIYFINPQYLCRLFKKETGVNFTGYVNMTRIGRAKNLLKIMDDTILNISIETGFNNVTYFNRIFKRYEGVTPSQYRNMH